MGTTSSGKKMMPGGARQGGGSGSRSVSGPLVKMSPARVRGLMNDGGYGEGGEMAELAPLRKRMMAGSARRGSGGGGGGANNRGKSVGGESSSWINGEGRTTTTSSGTSRNGGSATKVTRSSEGSGDSKSMDSLPDFMQNRTHFDVDDDDDNGSNESDYYGKREAAGVRGEGYSSKSAEEARGRPPAVVASAAYVPPRGVMATPTRRGRTPAPALGPGITPTRTRRRRHRSTESNSSLSSVESLGISGGGGGAAAGMGMVARAVARVEDGPEDDTVKVILAKAKAKQIAEEIAGGARKKLVEVSKVSMWTNWF